MSRGIRRVYELSGNKCVRNLLCKLVGFGDRALHSLGSVREHKLCAVCLHELAALNRHGFGHDDDDPVPARRGDRRKTDSRVAACRLDDNGILVQESFRFRIVDHRLCDTVLDRAGGIEVFKLCQDSRFKRKLLFDMCELEKRSASYELICRGIYFFRHDKSPFCRCAALMRESRFTFVILRLQNRAQGQR